ncbi:hypothetical protein VCR3J2_80753 [Vibrio coralliirubri]|nr:hypothetical protein VCR3J2_80753 [Vibrio coralliirubri]
MFIGQEGYLELKWSFTGFHSKKA